MEWQPIETAPKDGSRMILASFAVEVPDGPLECQQTIGCWDHTFESMWDDEAEDVVHRGAWTDHTVASFAYEEYAELNPKFWMPLPDPPSVEAPPLRSER